ncbi:hypothetical protein THAOC_10716, partial [Thalassiosira oceanica]
MHALECISARCVFTENHQWSHGVFVKNVVPVAKHDVCPTCAAKLEYKSCDCYWHIRNEGENGYVIDHHGHHNHRAPYPKKAHFSSDKKIEEQMKIAPELSRVSLTHGSGPRNPAYMNDLAYLRKSTLGNTVRRMKASINKQVTGSATAPVGADMFVELLMHLHEKQGGVFRFVFDPKISKEPFMISILFAKNKDAYKGHWAGVLDSWMDGRKEHVQRSDTNDKLTDGCSENDAGTAPQDIADSNEDSAAGKTELEDLFPGHAS